MVDTKHELPIAFELTDAATNEKPVARLLVDEVEGKPKCLTRAA